MREMILSETVEGREKALEKILPYQKADFLGIFRAMEASPSTCVCSIPPSTNLFLTIKPAKKKWPRLWA